MQRTAVGVLLNALTTGVILLDAFAVVIDMNAAAIEMVGREDGLRMPDSRLRALRPGDDRRLQRAVRSALARRTVAAPERIVTIPRRSGLRPYLVWAQSPPRLAGLAEGTAPRAVLWVTDPERERTVSEQVLRHAWGLTPREAQVTAGLIGGRSRAEVARALRLSENAVKFHLRGIYRKTGTHRVDALVALAVGSFGALEI